MEGNRSIYRQCYKNGSMRGADVSSTAALALPVGNLILNVDVLNEIPTALIRTLSFL